MNCRQCHGFFIECPTGEPTSGNMNVAHNMAASPYFHNGIAANDVVELYDAKLDLRLEDQEKLDVIEYLKSL